MNAQERAAASYGSTSAPVKSPRQIEYQAFARVTRAMNAAAEKDDTDPTAFPASPRPCFKIRNSGSLSPLMSESRQMACRRAFGRSFSPSPNLPAPIPARFWHARQQQSR